MERNQSPESLMLSLSCQNWTKILCTEISNQIHKYFFSLFKLATENSKLIGKSQKDYIYGEFQKYCKKVVNWSQTEIENHVKKVEEKFSDFRSLLDIVLQTNCSIMASARSNSNMSQIEIPNVSRKKFIHQCYIDVAKNVGVCYPSYFDPTMKEVERINLYGLAQSKIYDSVHSTIISFLPLDKLLKKETSVILNEFSNNNNSSVKKIEVVKTMSNQTLLSNKNSNNDDSFKKEFENMKESFAAILKDEMTSVKDKLKELDERTSPLTKRKSLMSHSRNSIPSPVIGRISTLYNRSTKTLNDQEKENNSQIQTEKAKPEISKSSLSSTVKSDNNILLHSSKTEIYSALNKNDNNDKEKEGEGAEEEDENEENVLDEDENEEQEEDERNIEETKEEKSQDNIKTE